MELIFNELSLREGADDRDTARAWMDALDNILAAAFSRGLARVLRIHRDFWTAELAEGYSLYHWGRDPRTDRERARRFRSIASKAPFVETLHENAEQELGTLAEYSYDGDRCLGIGLAALRGDAVISVPHDSWQSDHLRVLELRMDGEDLAEGECDVRNWYEPQGVERAQAWLRERLEREVESGADIVDRRQQMLPYLEFTTHAIDQLNALRDSNAAFPFVVRHLLALNLHAASWTNGPFQQGYPFPCSRESSATLQRFASERTFTCPDGEDRVFSWHSKINHCAWRIHFVASGDRRTVTIGYVGPHLRTVSDPT